jgi:hypothetical protein
MFAVLSYSCRNQYYINWSLFIIYNVFKRFPDNCSLRFLFSLIQDKEPIQVYIRQKD